MVLLDFFRVPVTGSEHRTNMMLVNYITSMLRKGLEIYQVSLDADEHSGKRRQPALGLCARRKRSILPTVKVI